MTETKIEAKRLGTFARMEGAVWRIGSYPFKLMQIAPDLEGTAERARYVDAVCGYLRAHVTTLDSATLYDVFRALVRILAIPDLREAIPDPDAGFLRDTFQNFKEASGLKVAREYARVARQWFIWCANSCIEGFDPDVATLMEDLRVNQGRAGSAVRRLDPGHGPLSMSEEAALETGLWTAAADHTLPPTETAVGLLFFLLGCNPENLCRLDECDFDGIDANGLRILHVPRVKKGFCDPRAQRVPRPLIDGAAAAVQRVIDWNNANYPPSKGEVGRPLFRARFGARVTAQALRYMVNRVARALELLGDDGAPLRLYPRRLRYTFARRAVREGATPQELMDLLDHSSIATGLIYYDPRSSLVDILDEKLGPVLAPLAAIAMGDVPAPAPLDLPTSWPLAAAPHACLACRHFRAVSASSIAAVGSELTMLADSVAAAAASRPSGNEALIARASEARHAADQAADAIVAIRNLSGHSTTAAGEASS